MRKIKTLKSLFVLAIMMISVTIEAQITKTTANEIVMNALNNDTTILVYSLNESVGRGESIFTADGEEIRNPYDNAYVYFIDDIPTANWAHPCRYCFVNVIDGDYTLLHNNIHPRYFDNYEKITETTISSLAWSGNLQTIPNQVAPNEHQWAVLICSHASYNIERFWGDLSCVYTTLTNRYGYIENETNDVLSYFNHIIVFAPDGVINNKPLDLNNSGGNSDNDFITENMVYAGDKEISYDKESIQIVFDNLAGRDNSLQDYGYRALDSLDKLFVYVTGHGHTTGDNSYIYIASDETIYDYELADMVKNINCSQMTFLLQSCYCGGFVDELSDVTNTKCKNRVVQTATSDNRYSHVENNINYVNSPSWPTRDSNDDYMVCEFTYYWCAALLGYYPIIRLNQNPIIGPWNIFDNNIIGSFPWNMFFDENAIHNHIEYDVSPDTDCDGVISMNEAFVFARKLDSWDTLGYYNPPYSVENNGWIAAEYPQASYESTFTQELITLDGYKGEINGEAETGVGHNYILDGDVAVDTDGSLTINSGSTIIGNINGRSIINAGSLSTAVGANNVTFRNVVLENNGGDMFNLSHCVFDSCGTILTYNGPVSLIGNTFNETRIKATTNNPPRNEYCIVISSNTFNNTVSNNTIYLEKIPRCNVSGNIITAGGNGIYINRLDGAYQNYIFSNNIIRYCGGSGFISYASNGKLRNNSITSNGSDGIQSLNLSNLYVRGDSTVTLLHDTQKIQGNDRYQIYATNNSHPHDFRYNWLGGNGTNNDVILYFESNQMQDERPSTIDVYNNCWYPLADNNIPSHLLASGDATFNYLPTWTPTGIDVPGEPGPAERLSRGNSLVENGDYDGARIIFMDIVSDFPESPEAIAAIKALYSVEVGSDGDFSDLKDYYIGLLSDDFLGNTADNLANRCDVEMGNYYDAIEWYEYKIIDTNSTYSERIFAEIDLGDLYLQMDENGYRGIKGKMPEFVPTSKEAHMKHTEHLLSLLPGDMEEGALYDYDQTINHNSTGANLMISPNPTSGEISLSFKFENECNVVVNIFNVLGNVVKNVSLGRLKGGIHEERLDLSDMPDGMYFCSLSTDNENKNIVKIFVRH